MAQTGNWPGGRGICSGAGPKALAMKRHKGLWEKVVAIENVAEAARETMHQQCLAGLCLPFSGNLEIWESMKTTLEVPDEVYRNLKVRAAREGVTITKLVVAALSQAPQTVDPPVSRRLKPSEEKKMAAWLKKESPFLDSMRGPVSGQSAVEDLIQGRR